MPSRAVLERQLKLAEHKLAEVSQALQQAGCEASSWERDPMWRHSYAACTALRRRLAAVAAIEAINAEVERRKHEPKVEEAPPEPEVQPSKKEKKSAAAPPPKAEAAKPAKKPKTPPAK